MGINVARAMLPVTKAVAAHTVYKDNPAIKAFGDLTTQLIAQYPHMQVFGSVGEKNFTGMGMSPAPLFSVKWSIR